MNWCQKNAGSSKESIWNAEWISNYILYKITKRGLMDKEEMSKLGFTEESTWESEEAE